jgi:hypothetical protein
LGLLALFTAVPPFARAQNLDLPTLESPLIVFPSGEQRPDDSAFKRLPSTPAATDPIVTRAGQSSLANPVTPVSASLASQLQGPNATPMLNGTDFPPLPPDPNEHGSESLLPLDEELWWHGGSFLYSPEGDHLNWPDPHAGDHYQVLRLPENWQAPQPITLFDDYLGSGPIPHHSQLKWPGQHGYVWDPQVVMYGAYELIGIALEENDTRHDLIAHQLLVDVDVRLTGTERFHMQWRPVGEGDSGGSFYQFSEPKGYFDNSTALPERYWFEGEIASIFGGLFHNPFIPRDYNVVVGKFPFQLHNRLLINDEILGAVVSKNTIYCGDLSNLNVQLFAGLDDVDAFTDGAADVYGAHVSADWRRVFFEMSFAQLRHSRLSNRDAQYAALSATKSFGPTTVAARALAKWSDAGGRGSGQLLVLEANKMRIFDTHPCGIEKGLFYATAFRATKGWNSIAGGNFDRLRLAFAVDPLVTLSAQRAPDDNYGVTFGVQLFRHHEDESIIPEIAFEAPQNTAVLGVGIRYQRKTGKRSYFELQGIGNFSEDPQFRRQGVFLSETINF